MINLMIVEDDPMARQLLEIYVNKSEQYELVGSVESALFAEAFCRIHPVDVILIVAPGYTEEIAGVIRGRFGEKVRILTLRSEKIESL